MNAAILPASRSATPLKPIVTTFTFAGLPPACATTVSSAARSDGTPVIPTVRPTRSAAERRCSLASAIGAPSGRCTIAMIACGLRPAAICSVTSIPSASPNCALPASTSASAVDVDPGGMTRRSIPARR